jgi:hypothetical protein
MRDLFYKVMPWATGGLLGWFLFRPPAWLESLGPMAYVVNGALCGVALLFVVAFIIAANLPARLTMQPLPETAVPGELRGYAAQLEGLGFRPAGPPRKVQIAPPATLLAYVHQSEPVYAMVFQTGTVPAKTSFDFVSILHGDRGGLTTNREPEGAALPEAPGAFRQVLPGQSIEALYKQHLDGIAYLRQRDVHVRAVSEGMFEQDFSAAMARQRELFLSSPIKSTLVTLWRASTKRVPFVGALREQPIAQQQLQKLKAA